MVSQELNKECLILFADKILEYLDINYENEYKQNIDSIVGISPCHEEADNPHGFSYKYDWGIWSCWTHHCEETNGNDLIGLVATIKKTNREHAKEIIYGILKNENFAVNKQTIKKKEKIDFWKMHINQKSISPYELKKLKSPVEYCIKRGFNSCIVKQYGIGIATEKEFSGRLVVPIRNVENKIVGFSGRLITYEKGDKIPKWMHYPKKKKIGDEIIPGFTKSINFFNIENVYKYLKEQSNKSVILVEGPFDVIRLEMAGIKNSLAVLGNHLCNGQIEILEHCNVTDIVLSYDADKAGQEGLERTMIKLKRKRFTLYKAVPQKKDWGESTTEEILNILDNKTLI